jgi:hypothetical protein
MMKAKLLANLKLGLLYLFSIFNWLGWFMVLDATLNNISVIIVAVSFISRRNQSTRRKPPTYR